MTIDLLEPRGATVTSPPMEAAPDAPPVVTSDSQEHEVLRSETYYFIVEFPTPELAYQEPDTDEEVSLDDLRAISKRHAATEEDLDPEPGWPEGWR